MTVSRTCTLSWGDGLPRAMAAGERVMRRFGVRTSSGRGGLLTAPWTFTRLRAMRMSGTLSLSTSTGTGTWGTPGLPIWRPARLALWPLVETVSMP